MCVRPWPSTSCTIIGAAGMMVWMVQALGKRNVGRWFSCYDHLNKVNPIAEHGHVIAQHTWNVLHGLILTFFCPELFPILQHQRRFLERRHHGVERYQKPRQYRTRYTNHSRVPASSSSVSDRTRYVSDSRVSASSSGSAASDHIQHANDSRGLASSSAVSDRTWFANGSRVSASSLVVSDCTWFVNDSRVSASSSAVSDHA